MSKNYEELTIRDPFMFGKICSKPENRKLILDSLLQIDLHEKSGEIEKYLSAYKDSKFARLDLISEDELNKIYNAEMQNESTNKSRQDELPNRGRFYQSIIDTSYFKSGMKYSDMPETFIIFICTFDPYKKGLPFYTFDTKCNEIDLPEYDDRAHKIFFNTTASLSNLPQSMQNMLRYINNGKVNDSATETLDKEIKEARLREEWRSEYMLTLVHDNDVYVDGFDEGFDKGVESCQSEIDSLKASLSEKDTEIEMLKKQIESIKDK